MTERSRPTHRTSSRASRSPNRPPGDPASRRRGAGDDLARDPALERATSEHYEDPFLYDHEYHRRRADVNYYRALAGGRIVPLPGLAAEREVLELGAGTGRLLVPLVRDGLRVTGVDVSRPMLDRCRDRLDALPKGVAARARLVEADFRELSLRRRFPLVISPFNAMMHLYTRADLERFLGVVRAHLAPGGMFAFDVLNPDLAWLVRDPTKRWARTRYKDPRTGRTYYYSTNHVYDGVTQINWIRIYYDLVEEGARGAQGSMKRRGGSSVGDLTHRRRGPEGRRKASGRAKTEGDLTFEGRPTGENGGSRVVQLAQRQWFTEELLEVLHYNGFRLDAREGGFVGEPFEMDSESQVCRCSIATRGRR